MRIFLLCRDNDMFREWNKFFASFNDVEIVHDDFAHFMDTHDVECIVSPANSYGLMDGGYDLAITKYYGMDIMKKVQEYIIEHFHGEQPVATSFCIDIPNTKKKLIHTPTMRVPNAIKDPMVVYQAMRTTLLCAKENNIKSIVIPAFGEGCGFVRHNMLARLMFAAYMQIEESVPNPLTWEYANRIEPENEYWLERHGWV